MVARILAWVVTELTKAVTTVSILNSDIYLFIYILSFTQDAARSSENTIYNSTTTSRSTSGNNSFNSTGSSSSCSSSSSKRQYVYDVKKY